MDKTGTLTKGEPEVAEVVPAAGLTEEDVVAVAAAVERGSEHPIAKAILRRAEGLRQPAVSGFEAIPGHGARAQSDGSMVLVGNLRLMQTSSVSMDGMMQRVDDLASEGRTVIYVARDGRIAGLIAVADAPRPTSKEAVRRLKEQGVEVIMLTGDNWATARRIAADLGVEKVFAEVSLLVLVAAAFLVVGCTSSAAQSPIYSQSGGSNTTAAAGLKQTSQGGSVTIEATGENSSEAEESPVRFTIVMDTHSVDLDSYDLGKLGVLRNDEGADVTPETWDAPRGGHHRSGRLIFPQTSGGQPVIGPQTKRIELVIRDVAGVNERSLQWEVPR